ncbi:MAG: hypothetical protein U1E56_06455 [Bauldia sp.]
MRRLLAALVAALSMLGIGAAFAAFDPTYMKRPADPFAVAVETADDGEASEEIGPTGGRLSLTAKDGTVYTLDIPRGALRRPTTITMTPLRTPAATQRSYGRLTGVMLQPDGIELDRPAVLTIRTRAPLGAGRPLALSFHGQGEEAFLTPVRREGNETAIALMHFSGAAAAPELPEAALRQLMDKLPSATLDRLLHGMVAAGERARQAGGDVAQAQRDFVQANGLLGIAQTMFDAVTAMNSANVEPAAACRNVATASQLMPLVRIALAGEALKVVRTAGEPLSAADVTKILETLTVSDAIMDTAGRLDAIILACLDFMASYCASSGDPAPLIEMYKGAKLLHDVLTAREGALSLAAQIEWIQQAMPGLDRRLLPVAQKLTVWTTALANAGDPRRYADDYIADLRACARYRLTWHSDARLTGPTPGAAAEEERFVGDFAAELGFEPGTEGDPIETGRIVGQGSASYPVFFLRLTKTSDFLSQRIVSPLTLNGRFEAEIGTTDGFDKRLDLRAAEPGVTYRWESCWRRVGCKTNEGGGSPLSVTYSVANKLEDGWMHVTDLARIGHPLLFRGTVRTHVDEPVPDGIKTYDDASEIALEHIGTGDKRLAEAQVAANIRRALCREFLGRNCRD